MEPQAQQASAQPAGQDSATDLVASLLSSIGQNQPAPAPKEEAKPGLGGLLSSLLGVAQQQEPKPQASQPSGGGLGNLLGSLLGGQSGQAVQSQPQQGFDTTTLLSSALAYYMAQKEGKTSFGSILQAVGSNTRFSGSEDRTQSGALVANTLLGLLSD